MVYSEIDEILVQDLSVAIDTLEDDNIPLFNILANRIVSNLYFGDKPDFLILGFIFKEIQGMLLRIKRSRSKSLYEEYKDYIVDEVEEIKENLIENKLSLEKIWEFYVGSETNVRKFLLDDSEFSQYKLQPEFTRYTTRKMINLLDENRDIILSQENRIISGCTNEIGRVINSHGFTDVDLMIYLLLKITLSVYEYRLYEQSITDNTSENEKWIANIINFIKQIDEDGPDRFVDNLTKSNGIIQQLGGDWRLYYVKYRDLFREVTLKPSNQLLDSDERKSLVDNLTEMIEKEVKA